ncbi:RNA-binding protein 33 isoform X2 [Morus notabilis]|uniref:RNA-binding protein 33 isoform X2 n=1 Tax=Morus notabilis TaxID=981085 RepID=UPI000CED2D89|nr:RNA-binding protein 33 isoform X2 [Morus notabilis]
MGFDNECILNIQSLAGEYFCPVCRLLVYPTEALQSQCTHLYCKPCLTYIVSTTRACPYDGYLVTESDSKPLIESNESLAETIGKIAVHCLYHRSGCSWQGSLSDCTAHCSGCAFGNSPVVCNRCGTQIVHRQVQEHALTCPPQAQQVQAAADASACGTAATADQTQSATQAAAVASQAQPLQTAVTAPGKDLNQQSVSSSQAQPVVQAAVPSAEQWYQQQQQYQQYYQQYPGYDPYQQQYQQYYPYQQAAVPQYQQQAHASNAAGQLQPQVFMQPQLQLQPQTQPQSQPQASVATQPQNQAQINQQRQAPSIVPPHSQIHPQTYPSAPGQPNPQPQVPLQPHPQPVQLPQYQQLHPQPQIQQQIQSQVQPQNPPSVSQAQPLGQLQPSPQPNQPPNANFQSQTQHPSAHAVTGHHSFPQLNNDPQVQIGGPQQFPKQPLMRPPHPQATIPNQQQPVLLPSPGQVQNNPSVQQQSVQHSYFQPPGQPEYQRPIMQPVQQTFPQQHYQQPQLPMPSQFRPTGPSHLFPPQTHAYPQPPMQHAKSPNVAGRPSMPQGVQAPPFTQYAGGVIRPTYPGTNQQANNQNNILKTNNQMKLPSEEHSGANSTATMSIRQGNQDFVKGSAQQEVVASSHKTVKVGTNNSDSVLDLLANVGEVKTEKSKTDLKSTDPVVKPMMKEEDVESTLKNSSNGKSGKVVAEDKKDVLKVEPEKMKNSTVEDKDVGGSLQKKSPLQAVERHEGQGGDSVKDAASGSDRASKVVPTPSAQILRSPASGGEVKSPYSRSVQVQGHQLPGPPPLSQVPPPGPPHKTQEFGASQTHCRPQVPGDPLHPPGSIPGSAIPFGRGPNQYGPNQQSSELQSLAPQRPYNPGPFGAFRLSQGEPTGAESSGVLQPRAFNSHGGMMARPTPHGPEMFSNQRPDFMDSRGPDPHFAGSLEHGAHSQSFGIHPNMTRMNDSHGFDSLSTLGPRDERFNPFPAGPNPRAEFEDDLKQFPRPFDRGLHGLKYHTGLKMDSGVGSVPSRSLSPYNGGGANDGGDRLGWHRGDAFGRMDPTRGHLDFLGPGLGYDRRRMDSLASRSPIREHPGISLRGFVGPGPDDIHGRELRRFGEPFDSSFHESRFSMLPGHLRRGEFEGPRNMGMGDHLRNDLIGRDGLSGPLRWGEHMGDFHGHFHLGEPVGFGAHSRHARIREIGGPGSFDSFGRGDGPSFPHLGEPGFRSRFSSHGFPTGDGIFTEDLAFDKSRKRKLPTMGWCRICKVDCETVEGLELHSQTREHQKMAMDMVVAIKQNAKKQKLTFGDQSSLGDASQPRSAGTEGHGKDN